MFSLSSHTDQSNDGNIPVTSDFGDLAMQFKVS